MQMCNFHPFIVQNKVLFCQENLLETERKLPFCFVMRVEIIKKPMLQCVFNLHKTGQMDAINFMYVHRY